MRAWISRTLMLLVVVGSYLEVRNSLGQQSADSMAARMARLDLAGQILISSLFFIANYFPEAIHVGWLTLCGYTPKQRERVQPLLQDAAAAAGLLSSLYFAAKIHLLIQQALAVSPGDTANRIAAFSQWLLGGLLGGLIVIIVYYHFRINAEARKDAD